MIFFRRHATVSVNISLYSEFNFKLISINMKKNILFLIVCLVSFSVIGQNKEVRNVGTFSKISFRVPGKLLLRQGNAQKVEIQGDQDVLSEIDTKVEGNRLTIEKKNKSRNWNSDDDNITVYVTVQNVESLHVGGSGDLIAETKITGSDIDLNVSGSGSLKAEVEATGSLDADVSGSGDIEVRGRAQSFSSSVSGSGKVNLAMNITENANFGVSGSGKIEASGNAASVKTTISGSGKLLAANLETNSCDVKISGSGDVQINVKNELDATISGSGTVSYKGNPSKVNSHASGSGRVSKM